jgi:hypothetical protein
MVMSANCHGSVSIAKEVLEFLLKRYIGCGHSAQELICKNLELGIESVLVAGLEISFESFVQ